MTEWIVRAKAHAHSVTAGKAMQEVLDHGLQIIEVEKINNGDLENGYEYDYVVLKFELPLVTCQQLEIGKVILKKHGIET